jgi:Xaa-Pro dipeptidase
VNTSLLRALGKSTKALYAAPVAACLLFCFCGEHYAQSEKDALQLTRAQILKMKVERVLPQAMRERGIDCWLVFTRENARDPIAEDIGGGSVVARSAFIFHLDKSGKLNRTAIVASYDTDGPTRSEIYDQVIAYRDEGIKPHLKKLIEQLNPQRIAINGSRDEPLADGLTVGMRNYLFETLGEEYIKRMVSAEDLVVSFRSRRLPEEIEIYRRAVETTQQIITSALSSRVVMPDKTTEADIAKYMQDRARSLGAEVAFSSVTVGANRGHSLPTETIVRRGDLIRIDFGIIWRGYKTDIQRTAYVLRQGEETPPEPIRKMWETALKANRAAVAAMKPGVTGLDVDSAARKQVTSAGYQEYPHATGHPVGFEVHDAGAILGPDWKERYGSKVLRKLEVGQLFAVEPAVNQYDPSTKSEIGIGLEEDVVVEADGAKYLGTPQTSLILIW